jgi:VWFA-related protein
MIQLALATLAATVLAVVPASAGSPEVTPAPAADDERAVLAGAWLRDPSASDDVGALLAGTLAGSGGAPTGGFGWNRGGGSPGSRVGRQGGRGLPPGAAPGERAAERFADLARGLEILEIERDGSWIVIHHGNGETRVVLTDGGVVADGLGSRTLARFEGGVLVIESRTDRGGRTERLEPDADGERLTVITDLDGDLAGRARNLTIRTVFRRVERSERAGIGSVAADRDDGSGVRVERARLVESRPPRPSPAPGEEPASAAQTGQDPPGPAGTVIRILPPASFPGQLLTGRVLVQALTIDPTVQIVEFLLDGEPVGRRGLPPFEARIPLADPPREQVVEVVAYAASERRLGADRMVLNRIDPPFRVRVTGFDGGAGSTASLRVHAELSVPRGAALERVAFFRNDARVAELAGADLPASPGGEVAADVPLGDAGPQDYVRVTARLRDGRELEDVQLLQGADFSEEVDVRLVQLQVLAVDGAGRPVPGLERGDFSVREDGAERAVDRVYASRDVSLVLGLAIDSSGSMDALWGATRQAAERFLEGTLTERDKAFLVDFDTRLRLLQGVTGDRQALFRALDRLQPAGGTALYDSILYSLLQYQGEPGRRALIVLTDGFDSASRADPELAIELGRRLGVPVYVIAMRAPGGGPRPIPPRRGTGPGARGEVFSPGAAARNELRLITDPTGGRLFQVGSVEQVEHAFAQIQEELRSQYVVTYYSERRPEQGIAPAVDVKRKGVKVKTAVPLDLAN